MAPVERKGSHGDPWRLPHLRPRGETILEEDRAKRARMRRSVKEELLLPLKNYHSTPNNTDVSFLLEDHPQEGPQYTEGDGMIFGFLLPASLIPPLKKVAAPEDSSLIGDMGDPQKWMLRVFPSTKPTGRMDALALDQWLSSMMARLKEEYLDVAGKASQSAEQDPDNQYNQDVAGKLEFLRNTQQLFSVCMHELIRQTAVQCVERGQLLAKIWIRYVELVNVLAMLLKVDSDSKKEKEARYLRQIEILNRNYLQAVRALEVTVTEDVLRVEEFEGKIIGFTNKLKANKEEKAQLLEQLEAAREALRRKEDEVRASKLEHQDSTRRVDALVAQLSILQEKVSEQRRVMVEMRRHLPLGAYDPDLDRMLQETKGEWGTTSVKERESKPRSAEEAQPSENVFPDDADGMAEGSKDVLTEEMQYHIKKAMKKVLKDTSYYDLLVMDPAQRMEVLQEQYSGPEEYLEKWATSEAGVRFRDQGVVDPEWVRQQISGIPDFSATDETHRSKWKDEEAEAPSHKPKVRESRGTLSAASVRTAGGPTTPFVAAPRQRKRDPAGRKAQPKTRHANDTDDSSSSSSTEGEGGGDLNNSRRTISGQAGGVRDGGKGYRERSLNAGERKGRAPAGVPKANRPKKELDVGADGEGGGPTSPRKGDAGGGGEGGKVGRGGDGAGRGGREPPPGAGGGRAGGAGASGAAGGAGGGGAVHGAGGHGGGGGAAGGPVPGAAGTGRAQVRLAPARRHRRSGDAIADNDSTGSEAETLSSATHSQRLEGEAGSEKSGPPTRDGGLTGSAGPGVPRYAGPRGAPGGHGDRGAARPADPAAERGRRAEADGEDPRVRVWYADTPEDDLVLEVSDDDREGLGTRSGGSYALHSRETLSAVKTSRGHSSIERRSASPPDSRSQGRRSPDRRSPDRRRKGDDGCFSAESRTRERAPRDAPSSGGEDLSSSRGLSRGLSRMNLNLSVSNADRAALLAQRAREKEEELKNRIRLEQLSLQEQMDRLAKVCSKVDSMPSNPRVMHLSFIPNIYRPFFKATWKAYSPQEWTKERFNKLVDKLLSDRATYDDKVSVEPKKTFPEFVAAFFVTNFGAGVIAEKRMLDFFVNCKLNRDDPRIDVICSIAHIFEPCYPMDCYSLWHRMCQALRQSHRPVEPQVGFSQMLEEDLGFLPPSALRALVDAVRAVEPRSPGESHEVQLGRLLQAATHRWSEVRASHLLAPCHQLFEMVDTNKDNKVNQSEFQVLARLLGFLQDMDQRAIGQLFPDTTSLMTYERFTEIFQTQTAQRNAFPRMMHLAQLVTNMEADVRGALVAQGTSAPSAYPAPAPTPPRSSPRLHSPPHAMRAHTLGLDPWPPLPRQPVSLQEAVPRPPPPPAPSSLPASLEAGRANFHWQFSFQPAVKFGYKSQFPSPAHRALPPKATFVPSPKPLP